MGIGRGKVISAFHTISKVILQFKLGIANNNSFWLHQYTTTIL